MAGSRVTGRGFKCQRSSKVDIAEGRFLTLSITPTANFGTNVPTLDVRNINVLKVDVVEVDLAQQSTFCKSTI